MLSLIFKQMLFLVLMNDGLTDKERIHLIQILASAEKEMSESRKYKMIYHMEF